jgi:DNA-binding transcriptional ArsR family regulator
MSTDKRRKEYGGLTEPLEALIKQGITEKRSPQELAIEIAKALDGKSAQYASDGISMLTAPARMLITLLLEPSMTQRALSIYLGISEAAVQKTIRQLTEMKLVAKTKVQNKNMYTVDVDKFLNLSDIRYLQQAISAAIESEPF